MRRVILIIAGLTLSVFYLYVLYLAYHPSVSEAYRLYYLDRQLKYYIKDLGKLDYRLGEQISFTGAQPNYYLGTGWSFPEPWGVWTEGSEATLVMRPRNIQGSDLMLIAFMQAFIGPKHPRLEVEVIVNGKPVERWTFEQENAAERRALIPGHMITDRSLTYIAFRIHQPTSPLALGIGKDRRLLGIGLHWLRIEEAAGR